MAPEPDHIDQALQLARGAGRLIGILVQHRWYCFHGTTLVEQHMKNCSRTIFLNTESVRPLAASSRIRRRKLKPRSSTRPCGMRIWSNTRGNERPYAAPCLSFATTDPGPSLVHIHRANPRCAVLPALQSTTPSGDGFERSKHARQTYSELACLSRFRRHDRPGRPHGPPVA